LHSIQLTNIRGEHSFIGDLRFVLIAPNGQRIRLIENECNESKGFDFGINDNADRLRCAINRGLDYSPIDELKMLQGLSAQGDWTLRIIDNIPGDGGQLLGWEIQICTLDNPDDPVKIIADTLSLKPGGSGTIDASVLVYVDGDNAISDIEYIITQDVTYGLLLLGADTLKIGDSFTQADINNGNVIYVHNNTIDQLDQLSYIITDGEGAASEAQTLIINIKNNISTTTLSESFGIELYPNPVENILNILLPKQRKFPLTWQLYHVDGSILSSGRIALNEQQKQLNLSKLAAGVYFLRMSNKEAFGIEKIIIQ